jgi:hypothetical protein
VKADWEDLVCALVICKVRTSATELVSASSSKSWSINPFTNPNHVSSQPLNRDNIKVSSPGDLAHHQNNSRLLVMRCRASMKVKSPAWEALALPDNRVRGTILANNSAKACIKDAERNIQRKPCAIRSESVPLILLNTTNASKIWKDDVLGTIFVYARTHEECRNTQFDATVQAYTKKAVLMPISFTLTDYGYQHLHGRTNHQKWKI